MQGILTRNWKQVALFGVGVLAFLGIVAIGSTQAMNRAADNQSVNDTSVPNETNARIDVKIENAPTIDDAAAESEGAVATGDEQQVMTSNTSPDVEVQVDGVPVEVPENGAARQEIVTDDGSTSVNISSQNNADNGDSRSRSSIDIDVDSSSDSSVRVRTETQE